MTAFDIGQPVRRVEDRRLLSGAGIYLDDLSPLDLVHSAILYSPHAHARIRSIDTARALQANGVLAIYTSADLIAADLGEIIMRGMVKNRDDHAAGQAVAADPGRRTGAVRR